MAKGKLGAVEKRLHAAAAKFPGATLHHPWGENVYKVAGKVFVFFGVPNDKFGLAVKLPASSGAALMLPFTEPTGYGLGKAGWVSASFDGEKEVPEGLIVEWLEESYRAVAPKKLLKQLDGEVAPEPAKKKTAAKKPPGRAPRKK
jgi:predicted DNA-binding protein (MmcQ/YjbR family)